MLGTLPGPSHILTHSSYQSYKVETIMMSPSLKMRKLSHRSSRLFYRWAGERTRTLTLACQAIKGKRHFCILYLYPPEGRTRINSMCVNYWEEDFSTTTSKTHSELLELPELSIGGLLM